MPPSRPDGGRDGVLLALGTLTAVRVPAPARVDRRTAGIAMGLAPAAGLVPGVLALAAAEAGVALGLAPLPVAALAVAVLALATRGLHLDGLADTADGFAASYDRERALAVMRRGDTGPAGAATLVLVLLVQVGALVQALPRAGGAAVLVAAVAARAVLPVVCSRGVPAARAEGLGAVVAGSVGRWWALASVAAAALLCAAVGALGGLAPWTGALAVAAAVAGGALVAVRAVRRLGGVTGDVLGAAVEIGTTAALLVLAVV